MVIGVSPDPIKELQKFRAKQDLNFVLLCDDRHSVAEVYGAWGEKSMYGKTYMGIIRSHFVIDETGRVTDAQIKVSPEQSVRLALEACCPEA